MRILVVNAGSSSLKLRLLDDDDSIAASADIPTQADHADPQEVAAAIEGFGGVEAVGHRIVHGGTEFVEATLIDDRVEARLRALADLAPLHQAKSLAALDTVSAILPEVPSVACFDTAFHANIPPAASTYALPAEWRSKWNLRRYGFHGLSHSYASRRAAQMLDRSPDGLRIVTCHLGAGASLAAVVDGVSVDTTMGFTPLEGLVMATRSGSVDPGLVLWLEEHAGTPAAELAATLEHRSGLLGLAGTADMQAVIEAADGGSPDAGLALDVYVHRLRGAIASMTSSMGGLDALVFTGGVGENSPRVRALAAARIGFLGVELDASRNEGELADDRAIHSSGARVSCFVVRAREDIEIATGVRRVLAG